MSNNNLTVRIAHEGDAQSVVDLLSDEGKSRYWKSREQWNHFYRDYPEGRAVSLIAEIDDRIVGHYGLLPVRFGQWPALMGMHAYVANDFRGLTVISALMQETDRYAAVSGVKAICGFANPQFSLIKKTFFKWKIPFWLGFKSPIGHEDLSTQETSFYFLYSDEWFQWRFGSMKNAYISSYAATDGSVRKQLLKVFPGSGLPSESELSDSEGWSRQLLYSQKQPDVPCQPFSVKAYDQELVSAGIYDASKWFIEMGDSDTFSYIEWKDGL